ncbi:c-type cytochrome domain-containing protein [Dyadobacter sandarakinus]|uniref:Ribonuclease inhibitor n=1 Tax=Dyadobacter sandarakinus TaxID=2747268 RepID=A0ABX7IAN2_9BACT|nr:c-type cytochrome domain-containing protein [Dyadobacter sandarakinus]QRR02970.1 ribonuclease inhibitor [Dyadobacter sandarakinus]
MHSILLQASDWALFFGRFHPAIVHLPIGFLLIAALLVLGKQLGKIAVSESAVSFILLWSAGTATISCVFGYLLSLEGGYEEDILTSHMYQGIGVAVFSWIAWGMQSGKLKKIRPANSQTATWMLGIATILVFTTGHYGGFLTHGTGYLTQYTPEPFRSLVGMPPAEEKTVEIKPIANINEALVYADIVHPILETRCVQCHNKSKSKGDLQMDNLAQLLKGGESGPALIVGKGAESDLIKRCLLPESDDDHMPPKGKPQLTPDQISILTWWIDQGAPADKKVAQLTQTEAVKPALASLGEGAEPAAGHAPDNTSAVLGLKVAPGNEKAIEALRKAGLIVNTLSQDQNLLEVSAVNAPGFSDAQAALLTALAEQITWLKLGDTKITDQGLKEIAKLKNLSKLHLEHTGVTDAGMASLRDLPYLEYMNVVDTKVGDEGLKSAASIKALRSIYVWQSAVTDTAVQQLAATRPGLLIVNGLSEAAVAQFLKAGDTTRTKAP